MSDSIAILDFGSQTSQLIARRVREAQVYCELFPWDAPAETVLALRPKGIILSGSPASVYEPGAPFLPPYVLESRLPVLGICFGMQALTHTLGGRVAPAQQREYGPVTVESLGENPLLPPGEYPVWMSHGDRIEQAPPGFVPLARSGNSPVAMIGDLSRRIFGVQFTLSGAGSLLPLLCAGGFSDLFGVNKTIFLLGMVVCAVGVMMVRTVRGLPPESS